MPATFINSSEYAYESGTLRSSISLPSFDCQSGKFLCLIAFRENFQIDTVTDTAGNTWVKQTELFDGAGHGFHIWTVASATANASNVVTVSYTGGTNNGHQATLLQYTFIPDASPLDVAAITTSGGGGTSMSTASFTTAQANELCIVRMSGLPTFSAGSGFTARTTANNYQGTQDQFYSTVQTGVTASMNCAGSAGPILVVTFKEAGAAGTPTGTATETDTALALGGMQIRGVGLATETDTALALSGSTLAGLPFNTAPYEFGQRTGLDVADFSIYASTALNVSVYAATDVLLASQLFAYTESTGADGRLTRKTHASLTAGSTYIFVAVTTGGAMVASGRITAT